MTREDFEGEIDLILDSETGDECSTQVNALLACYDEQCAEIERIKAKGLVSESMIDGLIKQVAQAQHDRDYYKRELGNTQAQLATAKGEREELMTNLESCKGNELAAQNEILQQELDQLRRADKKRAFKVATEQQAKEIVGLKAELENYRSIAEQAGATIAVSELEQARQEISILKLKLKAFGGD